MRALANDREITATLGVPVRQVEAAAWLGSGLVCGAAGLLLADLFTSLDYTALTFLVISSLAAALIGRLRSLWVTLAGGLAVGLVQAIADPVLRRSRATARRRPSCSRSSRCSGSARHRVVIVSRTAAVADVAPSTQADARLSGSASSAGHRARGAVIAALPRRRALRRCPAIARQRLDQDPDGRRHLRRRGARASSCSTAASG